MDVLKPELEYIDGICYRINPTSKYYIPSVPENLIYNEDDGECSINTGQQFTDEDETDFLKEIEEIDGGRHKASFHVPNVFYSYIIGSKGATRKRLETETKTRIIVPWQGQSGNIVITGPDKYSVARARKRIKGIVTVQKSRSPFTHFISIPFTDVSFQKGFLSFKEQVLQTCFDRGIEEALFQNVDKLHLTVCLMVLSDDNDRSEASKAFQECKDAVIMPLLSNKNLLIDMTGIDYMNDDPSEVDVLFGKASFSEDSNLMQELVDGIISFFAQKGIIDRKYDQGKIHVTLMNTRFLNKNTVDEKYKKIETFDATSIMKNFSDFKFGQAIIDRIDLSLRHSTAKSGYYQATSSIALS